VSLCVWARGVVGLAGILPGLATSGCALNRAGEDEVAAAWERQQSRQPAEASGYAQTPSIRPCEPAVPPSSTQPVSIMAPAPKLRDYIIAVLEQNPAIKQAEQTARARAARIPQVTALPDPMLSTKTFPEPIRTAEGDNYFILGVSQKLPVPEKLARAGQIALEEARMAIAEWEQVRLRVIADVKRAYFRIYVVDRSIDFIRENQKLLRGLIHTARSEVAVGKRTQGDVLRAQVELSGLDARLIELRQRRTTSGAMLNRLLNREHTIPIASPQSFDIRSVDVTLEVLFSKAAEVNPELQRLQNKMDRNRAAVELAKLAYWPDFTLGFEWMSMEPRDAFQPPINARTGQRPRASQLSEDGSDNWAIVFGFNLPVWHEKIEGGIREAKRKLSASMHEYASARNLVHFRVEDALTNVAAQRELAELFDSTIIPRAHQAYEIARAGYKVGNSDFQYVIDNWQKWLVFTIQYHRAVGALEQSIADLEQAIGLSLSELEESSTTGG